MPYKITKGLAIKRLIINDLRSLLQGKVLRIYKGSVPLFAKSEISVSNLLVTITNNAQTVSKQQKVRVTPSAIDNLLYTITIDSVQLQYTSDGTAIVAEIIAEFVSLINSIGSLGVTATNQTTYFEVEADVAGVPFDIEGTTEDSVTHWAVETLVEDAYGLHWNDTLTSGILEKLSSQSWKGVNIRTGTATFFRIENISDDGSLDEDTDRIQGTVGVQGSSSDLIVNNSKLYLGAETPITDFDIIEDYS
jgi:hypothetical protein